ncbi:MAG TPA: Vms1/Ankzf1 family peptidyl-tRNA hydrolase, partial [Micromonosporaceae bacterium]|nr:Vms1/Ankzf1 family peptidyl-tRNA hydrolase [Micromonosporaceae bacterium]
GADVTAVPAGTASGPTRVVAGPDDEIERNAPGGWAQPRYQRRAEDSWQHNAAAVAEAATRALRDLNARLLLVAGDVRAVHLLRERLPAGIRREVTLRHLPGGRSPDGSEAARQEAIADAVDGHAADTTTALLDRFAERDRAGTVEGVAATLAALAAGRVGTLFLADEPDDARTAWYGPHVLCAATAQDVPDGRGRWRTRGRMVDIAARAAMLTDAEVRVVDVAAGRFAEGIGALCRYPSAG